MDPTYVPTWHDAPAAPLDVVAWLDERDRILGFSFSKTRDLFPPPPPPAKPTKLQKTHRLAGPATLDAEIDALDVDVRACIRRWSVPQRMKLTIDARALPARLAAFEPNDAPFYIVDCIAGDVREIRTVASAPVVIVAGPVP